MTPRKKSLRKLFEISFVIAKESIAFTKYEVLHELECHHGVDLGQAYKSRKILHIILQRASVKVLWIVFQQSTFTVS